MDTISIGKHNPRLSDIRKAIRRNSLTSDGLLPIEGPRLIAEARSSRLEIHSVLLRHDSSFADLPRDVPAYTLEDAVFKGIQATEHSQGVIALVRPKVWTLSDVLSKSPRPVVVLAGLQDPGNVGTILRVAESFGAAGCLALSGTVTPYNAKVVRASAGSVFRLPYVWDLEWGAVTAALKVARIPVIGTSPHAADSIVSSNWQDPAAVLIGNEGAGLTAEQAAGCDRVLRIPQEPQVESLNSALATAVILYEAYRQRNPQ